MFLPIGGKETTCDAAPVEFGARSIPSMLCKRACQSQIREKQVDSICERGRRWLHKKRVRSVLKCLLNKRQFQRNDWSARPHRLKKGKA